MNACPSSNKHDRFLTDTSFIISYCNPLTINDGELYIFAFVKWIQLRSSHLTGLKMLLNIIFKVTQLHSSQA